MNADLLNSDYVVLSHGHLDHTWGLDPLIKLHTEARIESLPFKTPTIVAHPQVFASRSIDGSSEIGPMISRDKLERYCNLNLTKSPFWLTDKLVFLGEIERTKDFENREPIGKIQLDDRVEDDFVFDDTALAYMGSQGLLIITGCSHSGICNIIEYAKKICKEDRVLDVIGGFHLVEPTQKQLNETIEYFRKLGSKELHACHCVDLDSKIALSRVANLKEVGVGLSLNYE